MKNQRGYIQLEGLWIVMSVLSVFGLFGVFALVYWLIPAAWAWLKPWLHMVTA